MSKHCKVKFCGVKREADVDLINQSGADYIGILVNMPSLRTNTPEEAALLAKRASILVVLLFMNAEIELIKQVAKNISPSVIQLQGNESYEFISELKKNLESNIEIWKVVHLPSDGCTESDIEEARAKMIKHHQSGADKLLLDTIVRGGKTIEMGGTGKTYDWNAAVSLVENAPCPVLMAGGLDPQNVSRAIQLVRPWGVDLASGIEIEKGVKDPQKITAFMDAVKSVS